MTGPWWPRDAPCGEARTPGMLTDGELTRCLGWAEERIRAEPPHAQLEEWKGSLLAERDERARIRAEFAAEQKAGK